MKDWLNCENARNKRHAALYTAMLHVAFPDNYEVMIGHHLTIERAGDLTTENEIPSADTMLGDHYIMGKIFGLRAPDVIREIFSVPVERRDDIVARRFAEVQDEQASAMRAGIVNHMRGYVATSGSGNNP